MLKRMDRIEGRLKGAVVLGGVATLNAVSQIILESEDSSGFSMVEDTDGFDLLRILPQDTVSLVGAFGPYIHRLKMMGNPFFVIERNPQTLRPDEMKLSVLVHNNRPESPVRAE
jgi:uncharacterized protein (DUF4213/DUF364 family)